jgi:AmmeMemoRadiSam system protein B
MVPTTSPKGSRVRPPAVAGIFYPGGATQLAKTVDELLGHVRVESAAGLRALICPHAGYRYSGAVAAQAFAQLRGQDVDRVLLMGPSHRVAFRGVALPQADTFETPLGRVALNSEVHLVHKEGTFICSDAPHEEEHSLEVQLPFLQRVLPRFSLTPLVFGDVDEKRAADALRDWYAPGSVLVASSDLSHYHTYDRAVEQDRNTIEHILRLETDALGQDDACGRSPVRTLMHLAAAHDWKPRLFAYQNSGDTSGDKSRVVGYVAIGFYA